MGRARTDEFHKDAVRIALTNGLTRKQFADDLGVGMSTLNKWITVFLDADVVLKKDLGSPKRTTSFGVRTAFLRRRGRS